MGSQVDGITTRLVDLGENLNYVLGKLSLSTQEFRQMAISLTKALDGVKISSTVPTVAEGKLLFEVQKQDLKLTSLNL